MLFVVACWLLAVARCLLFVDFWCSVFDSSCFVFLVFLCCCLFVCWLRSVVCDLLFDACCCLLFFVRG